MARFLSQATFRMPRSIAQSLFTVIHKIEEWLLTWAMILVAVLTITNVFSRLLFNHALAFAEELTRFMIIVICFVGLSYAASRGRHIRMTALYDLLPLRPRKILMMVIAAVTALLMFYLAYASVGYIYVIYDLESMSPTLRVPLFIVYLAAPIGLVLAGIQYLLTLVRNLNEPDAVYLSYDQTDAYEEAPAVEPDASGQTPVDKAIEERGRV